MKMKLIISLLTLSLLIASCFAARCEDTLCCVGCRGNTASCVKRIQRAVCASDDGDFGAGTEAKVIAFQKARGLNDDGKVGRGTWNAIINQPMNCRSATPSSV
jgi:peptidoglycan hydrolase-like protein with peptidoglycan-binding domain